MHSYIAYIDESGDDGFGKYRLPDGTGGASHFLVLSACVMRYSRKLEAVHIRDQIKFTTGKKNKGRSIHFAEFNHGQKKAACGLIQDKPLRFVSVVGHKPSLNEDNFSEKNQLYFYLCKYLIERVSWLCRDLRRNVPEGDGRVKIIFSRRGGMSYVNFQEYMRTLKCNDGGGTTHWPIIDIDAIEAKDHSTDAGLQLADCGASAIAGAFEPDRYGNVEGQYLSLIRNNIYSRSGNFLSYGLKFHPPHNEIALDTQQAVSLQVFK